MIQKAEASHRLYYGQFVNQIIKKTILTSIGLDRLRRSRDSAFNDIPLIEWDSIGKTFNTSKLHQAVKQTGSFVSKSTLVCIAKEAARQILEE